MPDRPVPELTADDLPVYVGQLALDEPLIDHVVPQPEIGARYRKARLLVRLHGVPLGYVVLPAELVPAAELARTVQDQLGDRIAAHLAADGSAAVAELPLEGIAPDPSCGNETGAELLPFISVVVCTRNRPMGAVSVLRSLARLDYPAYEVVLVDNAPSDDATQVAVEEEFGDDERVRYVLEPRPGLSCARNRGWNEAHGDIVAYTDDDTLVDEHWLTGIARGFRRAPRVGCVTGLVPTAELRNDFQLFFDQRVAWGASCTPRVFDMGANRPDSLLYPFAGSDFGTGANFAFRRQAITDFGGFDEALGAGAPTGGGEDLDAFVKTLLAGWAIVYEPSAIIGHIHRADAGELKRQMFTYGSGLTAFLSKYLVDPRTMWRIVRAAPAGVRKVAGFTGSPGQRVRLPRAVAYRELLGMAAGPYLYVKARRRLAHRSG